VEPGHALVGGEDAGGDDADGALWGEAVDAFDFEFEGGDVVGSFVEAVGEFGEAGVVDVADEFDGDVVVVGMDPFDVGLGGDEFFAGGFDVGDDVGGDVDGDEQSHTASCFLLCVYKYTRGR